MILGERWSRYQSKRRYPLSLCAYPKKRPALRAAFLRAPISSFAGQLLDDCRVLQRRDVLRDLLPLGDRAEQTTHDLAGARLRQVVGKAEDRKSTRLNSSH